MGRCFRGKGHGEVFQGCVCVCDFPLSLLPVSKPFVSVATVQTVCVGVFLPMKRAVGISILTVLCTYK